MNRNEEENILGEQEGIAFGESVSLEALATLASVEGAEGSVDAQAHQMLSMFETAVRPLDEELAARFTPEQLETLGI